MDHEGMDQVIMDQAGELVVFQTIVTGALDMELTMEVVLHQGVACMEVQGCTGNPWDWE